MGESRAEPAATSFKSLSSLSMWVIALLIAMIILDVIAIVSSISYLDLIERTNDGTVAFDEANSADERQASIAMTQLLSIVVTGIFFIIWFRRAYRNLGPLGVRWLRYKPGWAVGGWFVPFLNLVRPKQIANDIWRSTDAGLPSELDGPGIGRPVSPLLNWWWALFLISSWVDSAAGAAYGDESLGGLESATQTAMAGSAVDAIAALLAIFVVSKIAKRQHERYASLEQEAAMQPPPPPAR